MAPLPTTNTQRLIVKYFTGSINHELLFRAQDEVDVLDLITAARDFCTAARPLVHTSGGFISARYAGVGQILTFPITWAAIAGTLTGSAPPPAQTPRFLSFVARDNVQGRKTKLTIFTTEADINDNYRMVRGDNAAVDACLDVLQDPDTPFCSIADVGTLVWPDYADTGFNAYWQRKERRS